MKEDKDLLKELLQTKFKDDVMESSKDRFDSIFDAVQENTDDKSSFLWHKIGGVIILLISIITTLYILRNKTSNPPTDNTSIESPIENDGVDLITNTNDETVTTIENDTTEVIKQINNISTPKKVDVTTIEPEEDINEKGVITVTYKASDKYASTEDTKYNKLPDLSAIAVRRNSKVNFTASKQGYRRADITGTAFLNVHKDESMPFILFGKHSKIQVTGNSFAIHSDANADLMTLIAGTAKVVHNITKEVKELTPGQSLRVDNRGISILGESPNQFAWKTGSLHYKNANINEIINDLYQNYDARIQLKNVKILNCKYSGSFEQANTVKVLKAVALSLRLQVSKKEDLFLITGRGCSQ
ncbi:FecR domain-containing protein [Aquimarina sp. 2201CG14-23]|uniref:FecR domain-containing protein n=1 Tax=Aquimarina mycalae TaxID=3040073 RepID=UPI0024780874|nr:FecR domain-containing protein [Aquimarina sp. 2201CG14-23]MDH7445071.1 FecR domain-containing protein [Aquimarina sp. 2201CG14-23]